VAYLACSDLLVIVLLAYSLYGVYGATVATAGCWQNLQFVFLQKMRRLFETALQNSIYLHKLE